MTDDELDAIGKRNAEIEVEAARISGALLAEVQWLRRELKARALDERDGAFIDHGAKLERERDDARARVKALEHEVGRLTGACHNLSEAIRARDDIESRRHYAIHIEGGGCWRRWCGTLRIWT